MKIAFLGKGGSGKSTVSTCAVQSLREAGIPVLAIDADHNMDLSFNLGVREPRALGADPAAIKRFIGVEPTDTFANARMRGMERGVQFSIMPPDRFTQSVAEVVEPDLWLIAAGPHTDAVRSGDNCSHSLAAPLKVYVPLFDASSAALVIDERAGTDPVATGILPGIDHAFIVAEPTVHATRVARQIADELSRAEIPYSFIANKDAADADWTDLPVPPVLRIPFQRDPMVPNFVDVIRSAVARV